MSLPKLKFHDELYQEVEWLSSVRENISGTKTKVLDNEAIIRQTILNQPEKGFEMVYKRYYNQLCSHSLRYVYSTEAAEDIVSEVFLGFWRNELYTSVKTTFRAYLYKAVRNRSLDYVKSEFGLKETKERDEAAIENQRDMDDPQSILLMNELMNRITNSINNFPPQCQRVFLLSRIEGKKNREIADKLEINIKTVEAHMMKALASLRKALSDYI
jgi:RNA polymerase sigma-70 factor (ECF subfamily)